MPVTSPANTVTHTQKLFELFQDWYDAKRIEELQKIDVSDGIPWSEIKTSL